MFASGTHLLAAVDSGAGGGYQVSARVDLLADWIEAQIAAHGGPAAVDDGSAPARAAAGP